MNAVAAVFSRLLVLAESVPAGEGPEGNPLVRMLIFMVPMFVILYLLMIRPQRKRQRERLEMLESLKKGDKIITRGGIHGVITLVRDHDVVVKVDDNVKLTLSKAGVARVVERAGEKTEKNKH